MDLIRKSWHFYSKLQFVNFDDRTKNHLEIVFQTIFLCILAESFEAHYGEGGRDGDGDVFKEANIKAFAKFVLENTDGKGNFLILQHFYR